MRTTFSRRFKAAALAAFALAAPVFAACEQIPLTDVSKLDIDGLRLGMTVEDVLKAKPGVKIEESKAKDGASLGFTALVGDVNIKFASRDLGAKLYFAKRVEVFADKPDTKKLYDMMVAKYGMPDYSGRDMWRIHAAWGKPVGTKPRLIFEVKISGPVNTMFPMTLTLQDPLLESENHKLANKHPF